MKFAEEPPRPRPQTVEIALAHDYPGDLEDVRRAVQAKMPGHVTVRVDRAAPPDPRVTLTAKHPLAVDVVVGQVPLED